MIDPRDPRVVDQHVGRHAELMFHSDGGWEAEKARWSSQPPTGSSSALAISLAGEFPPQPD
jgi:hypothetical protein